MGKARKIITPVDVSKDHSITDKKLYGLMRRQNSGVSGGSTGGLKTVGGNAATCCDKNSGGSSSGGNGTTQGPDGKTGLLYSKEAPITISTPPSTHKILAKWHIGPFSNITGTLGIPFDIFMNEVLTLLHAVGANVAITILYNNVDNYGGATVVFQQAGGFLTNQYITNIVNGGSPALVSTLTIPAAHPDLWIWFDFSGADSAPADVTTQLTHILMLLLLPPNVAIVQTIVLT